MENPNNGHRTLDELNIFNFHFDHCHKTSRSIRETPQAFDFTTVTPERTRRQVRFASDEI
jgi:hypothetical protein